MEILPFVFIGIVFLVMVAVVALFAKYFQLWLLCFVSGAGVQFPQIVAMRLRNSPVRQICELRVKLKQNGIPVSAADLERAHLQGADIEKLTDAMLHAKRTDREITWDQLVTAELESSTS